MGDFEIRDPITAIERRLRRERLRKKRRRRALSVFGVLILLILAAFLFSPIGPFGYFLFPGSKAASDQEATENQAKAVAGAETGKVTEPPPKTERVEKESDPTAPTIAIVVDDTGLSTENLNQWLAIDAPITFSTLPYCAATSELAEGLYQAGFRIMMHIPTENNPPNSFSGKGQLAVGMDRATVFSTLDADLATVPHVVGINNHQGGRGCNDLQLMTYECQWAQERGLFVVDSDSSTSSKVTKAAASLGMPRRLNQLFIDHDNNPDYIRKIMRQVADIARRNGTAIGICHFHRPNTPRIVGEMIQTLEGEGIHFAFVQDIHN